MGKPPFHEVERLFHEALAHPSEERRAFLDAACAGDTELRAAVEELLCHAGPDGPTDGFLASPMGEAAAKVRADEEARSRALVKAFEDKQRRGKVEEALEAN